MRSRARSQTRFLAAAIGRGAVDIDDRDKLIHAMFGSLAPTPQVGGIAFFSAEGWSQRVGRSPEGLIELFKDAEANLAIDQWVDEMRERISPYWGGIFWAESLEKPYLTVSTSVYRDGTFLGVVSSIVSVEVLSHYVDNFQLQTPGP